MDVRTADANLRGGSELCQFILTSRPPLRRNIFENGGWEAGMVAAGDRGAGRPLFKIGLIPLSHSGIGWVYLEYSILIYPIPQAPSASISSGSGGPRTPNSIQSVWYPHIVCLTGQCGYCHGFERARCRFC